MREPQDLVEELESRAELPGGAEERFAGYGVMGLPFPSGHVLAMRRFPASSIGAAYTSVWFLDPAEGWTFWQDVEPRLACPRYFGTAVRDARRAPIAVEWTGPRRFHIRVDDARPVEWDVELAPSSATRAMNALGSVMPESWWGSERVLAAMSTIAGRALRVGKIRLSGSTPNGQHFVATPRLVWTIPTTHAEVAGRELAGPGPAPEQVRLGDFAIPQRGMFVIGRAFFEPFDAGRHREATAADS